MASEPNANAYELLRRQTVAAEDQARSARAALKEQGEANKAARNSVNLTLFALLISGLSFMFNSMVGCQTLQQLQLSNTVQRLKP